MTDTVENQVRTILGEILRVKEPIKINIRDDLEHVGMDSLNCMELIVKLEEVFHIQIPNEQLGLSYVRSVQAICDLVEKCLNDYSRLTSKTP